MDHRILFHFQEKEYAAVVHLSLQKDGCCIFTFFEDKDLISEFGIDIDIHTDCEDVLPDHISNDRIISLKGAILNTVKKMPQFLEYRPKTL
jgi:hypothetical protein